MGLAFVRIPLRPLSLAQIRYVSPVRFGPAHDLVAAVYRQMERDFGVLAPPVALHSPAPRPLAAVWTILRETLLVPGSVDRSVKEAVAAAVSVGNECPYCVTVHSSAVQGLVNQRTASAIAGEGIESIEDPAVRAALAWARANASAVTAAEHDVPFPAEQGPELVGVAVLLQYLNRMVNVFLNGAPLPPGVPIQALRPVLRMLTSLMRTAGQRSHRAGDSLDLLPAAPLPSDLEWAAANPAIAEAYARASAAVEAAGDRVVPVAVRELVTAELATWDGKPKGISRTWVEDSVDGLADLDRPAGRLALLIAFASYQVDESIVAAWRSVRPADEDLIGLTSWASMAAARRAGSWMRTGIRGRQDRAETQGGRPTAPVPD